MEMIGESGFGSRLRLMRLAREYSQAELARRVGRHQTAIGPYERGEYMPARDIVDKLAQVLGTSPEYLLFGRSPHRSHIDVAGKTAAGGLISIETGELPITIDDSQLVAYAIGDRSMAPAFEAGDYALVRRGDIGDISSLFGSVALVELEDGRQLLRMLLPASHNDCADLVSFNAPKWSNIRLKRVQSVVGTLRQGALLRSI